MPHPPHSAVFCNRKGNHVPRTSNVRTSHPRCTQAPRPEYPRYTQPRAQAQKGQCTPLHANRTPRHCSPCPPTQQGHTIRHTRLLVLTHPCVTHPRAPYTHAVPQRSTSWIVPTTTQSSCTLLNGTFGLAAACTRYRGSHKLKHHLKRYSPPVVLQQTRLDSGASAALSESRH
jgi:hypothetical protein